jgi:Uma2 family endonuclease
VLSKPIFGEEICAGEELADPIKRGKFRGAHFDPMTDPCYNPGAMKTAEISKPRSRRWTVEQYDRLAQLNFFQNEHVELIEGRIITMSAQLEPHCAGVSLAGRALETAFGPGFWVRRQNPLQFSTRSKPEPDVAVVRGSEQDYIESGTPHTALLVVEISDTTLRYDRGRKASLYAKYGIADYWIVNLVDRQLEVHRDPIPDPTHRFKFRFGDVRVLALSDSVATLSCSASISVAQLFPRRPQVRAE